MIVSRIFPDFDIEVTASTVTFYIAFLLEEIPVRHIYLTMRCEVWFDISEYLQSVFSVFEVMKGCKKKDDIVFSDHFCISPLFQF